MKSWLPSLEPLEPYQPTGGAGWRLLAGEGNAYVQTAWARAFAEAGLHQIDDFFRISGEELFQPDRTQRYRARLFLRWQGRPRVVYLERWTGKGLTEQLRRWCEGRKKQCQAAHEASLAENLMADGVPVAEPLAWGCLNRPDTGCSAFKVLAALPGEPLQHWLRRSGLPDDLRWQMQCELAMLLGELMRRFHDGGWHHTDLSFGHLFVLETVLGWQVSLAGLPQVSRPRWRRRARQLADLAQLNFSAARESLSRSMRMRFAMHYFGVKHLQPAQKALLRKVVQKTERLGLP